MNTPNWPGALYQAVIQGLRILSLCFLHLQSVASKAAVLICIQQIEGERERGTGLKGLCIILPTFHGLGLCHLAMSTCRERLGNMGWT